MAVVQNSFSGIWPAFAKKCIPLASSSAKLLWSLFSHVGKLRASTWKPTPEGPNWRFRHLRASFRKLGTLSGVVLLRLNLRNGTAVTHLSRTIVLLCRPLSQNFRESFKPREMVAQNNQKTRTFRTALI